MFVPDRAEWFIAKRAHGVAVAKIMFYSSAEEMMKEWTRPSRDDEYVVKGAVSELPSIFTNPDNQHLREAVQAITDNKHKLPKQVRYQDATGDDWIDECERTLSWPEFIGAMKFTIGKYLRRLGKKDAELQEIEKIADYSARWLEAAKRHYKVDERA